MCLLCSGYIQKRVSQETENIDSNTYVNVLGLYVLKLQYY